MKEDFYKSIIHESSNGYAYHKIICDDNGAPYDYEFIEVNTAFERLTGLKKDDIIGRRATEILPELLKDEFDWIKYYGEIALSGTKSNFDNYSEPLGKWFRVNVFSPDKYYFVTNFNDITNEINQLEEINNFFDVNLDLLCIANLEGYFIKLNQQWELTLGYTIEELNSKKFLDLVHPDDISSTMDTMKNLSEQKKVLNFINRYRCKDGSYKVIEWRSYPKGNLIYAAARDITEKVIEEKALKDLVAFSEKFLQFYDMNLDYQKITDDFLTITEAKVVAFNLYDEDGLQYTTKALSADKWLFQRGIRILGNKVKNSKWPHDPIRADLIKDNIITVFPSLKELAGHNLSNKVTSILTKTFGLGEVVLVKIVKNNIMMGDFTIIMPKGKPFTKHYLVEAYSRQLGLVISKKRTEEELVRSEEKYRLLAEHASDVIWVYNITNNRFSYISKAVELQRGYTVEEAMKLNIEESLTHDSYIKALSEIDKNLHYFIKNPNEQKYYIHQIQQLCKNGSTIWVEVSVKFNRNINGDIEIIGISRNIEERKKAEQRILYLSYNDQLTDVNNRRFFEEEIKRLDKEEFYPLTLIMLDVNGLKLINDAFGHLIGDRVLMKAANIMKSERREGDVVARIGGDEFVIILPNTASEKAEEILKNISDRTSREKVGSINLSISYGWETKTDDSQDIMQVLREAENYMYRQKLSDSQSMRYKTIDVIIKTLYEKSPREERHSKRVGKLCADIGRALGFSNKEVNELNTLGLMHDIGKIAIEDDILNKPSALDDAEWLIIKRHSEIGYRILSSINEYAQSAEFVLAHHEKWDGKGYPKRLKGEEIPLEARIIALADAYDAMTSNRTYRSAMNKEDAIEEIKRNSGVQFDPYMVEVFINKVLLD